MDEYEYVEINSIEELYEFIENATKEELILCKRFIIGRIVRLQLL